MIMVTDICLNYVLCKMEFVSNQKGGLFLLVERYTYRNNGTAGQTTYWVCSKNKSLRCHARINTLDGDITITNLFHDHTADATEKQVRTISAKIKSDAASTQDPPCQMLTSSNEEFILFDSGPESGSDRIIIFSTQRNLEKLSASNTWHGDGTFKCVPLIFTQL